MTLACLQQGSYQISLARISLIPDPLSSFPSTDPPGPTFGYKPSLVLVLGVESDLPPPVQNLVVVTPLDKVCLTVFSKCHEIFSLTRQRLFP